MQGVLWNFLGAFTSRYTDYRGYWLFGFLVSDLNEGLQIDLLDPSCDRVGSPVDAAVAAARTKFQEQCAKAGLLVSQLHDARLSILVPFESTSGVVNGRPCSGKSVCFRASAVMAGGRRFERERIVFVAAHNPVIEMRSYGALS